MIPTPEQAARAQAIRERKMREQAGTMPPVRPTPEQEARAAAIRNRKLTQEQAQAVPQAPKEEGVFKSMLKGMAMPFARTAVSFVAPIDAAIDLAMGYGDEANKTITEGYNIPGLGQVKPAQIASTPTIVKDSRGRERLEGGKFGRETVKTIGTGAEIAPWLFGGAQATALAKGGIKAPLKQILKVSAIDGLVGGAAGGAGSALQRGDATAGDVIKDALAGGAFGTALGVGIPLIGKAGSKILTKGTQKAAVQKAQKAAMQDVAELGKLERKTPALQKYVDRAKKQDFDVRQAIAETDLLVGSVDDNGLINTVQEGGAIERMNKFLEPRERVVSEALNKEGRKIALADVEKALLRAVDESGAKGAAKKRAYSSVADEIEGLRFDADRNGMIDVAEINNAKIDKYRNINYLDPSASRLDKSLAKKLKELVEENTDSIDVKAYNEELSKFYTMLGYLEKLNNKRVEGGRLGKYVAQGVGAVVGSNFGPFGAIAGSELGGLLKGQAMKSIFAGPLGRSGPQVTARMTEALKPKPRPPVAGLLPAPRKPLPGPLDQYIPQKSRLLSQDEARAALRNTVLDPTRTGQGAIPLRGTPQGLR